jgi:hypothetical protein
MKKFNKYQKVYYHYDQLIYDAIIVHYISGDPVIRLGNGQIKHVKEFNLSAK